jgi:hypothetical protein
LFGYRLIHDGGTLPITLYLVRVVGGLYAV